MANENSNQVAQKNTATRLELMAEFREAMKAVDPSAVVGDGVIHPSFKLKPEEFKFAQSQGGSAKAAGLICRTTMRRC